jgi:hypothetical protein
MRNWVLILQNEVCARLLWNYPVYLSISLELKCVYTLSEYTNHDAL